ncbi:unnamed protein product, partial [Chrysoparadoxa australica]
MDLRENKLERFPAALPSEAALTRLLLSFNRLTAINVPALEGVKDSLVELHLQDNAIADIPPAVAILGKLKVLFLSNNSISDVPSSLGYMTALSSLSLDGNAIRTVRQTVLAKPLSQLKAYLRSRGPAYEGSSPGGTSADAG